MRVAIVGCGAIGFKRAAALSESEEDELVIGVDIKQVSADRLAAEYGCEAATDWSRAVDHAGVDAVIVATVNKELAPITIGAARAGKHVLCEKPLGRNAEEARQMVDAAASAGVVLKTGFNHRYHPALLKAKELVDAERIGRPVFARCVYGHGGRPGYDQEWRADPKMAGGGELLDQGVHVVDLCRWFLGEFDRVVGVTPTYVWGLGPSPHVPNRAPVEDNAFAIMQTADGRTAQLHTSWTQWKNRFSFEVFGDDGYIAVEGLGGSYGPEKLTLGTRKRVDGSLVAGAPDLELFDFPGPDGSWRSEWADFASAVRNGTEPMANGTDGLEAMKLIEAIYSSARTGGLVTL